MGVITPNSSFYPLLCVLCVIWCVSFAVLPLCVLLSLWSFAFNRSYVDLVVVCLRLMFHHLPSHFAFHFQLFTIVPIWFLSSICFLCLPLICCVFCVVIALCVWWFSAFFGVVRRWGCAARCNSLAVPYAVNFRVMKSSLHDSPTREIGEEDDLCVHWIFFFSPAVPYAVFLFCFCSLINLTK